MRTAIPILCSLSLVTSISLRAQLHDPPDRGAPGDFAIQSYLAQAAKAMETNWLDGVNTAQEWNARRPRYYAEYMAMLGLAPLPEKTPLHATITRTLNRGDYLVDMIHFQSRPGLYVTGNLYRPAQGTEGQRLPAVVYVCGHSYRGRDGNKTAYQSHGIWFARHGYICLTLDTLQLGEIAGVHHGTYREGRWWWLSRGYTPAGVECWNGLRAIDYLVTRQDVDADRIGVTGISGGGAATYWIAAADERVKVAVPVSGMADLESYVSNRVVNGHCDCMFLYNAYQWPWTRIAALIAPRPLLFVNSDHDDIFPMDANDRVINRLERLYSLFGRGDDVDALVSMGGHAYRRDIRQAAFRFINAHLKGDPREVTDSEVDLVAGEREPVFPITPQELRVFPTDADLPGDARNGRIDQEFVPLAAPLLPEGSAFPAWKAERLASLRELTFHHFPARVVPAEIRGGTNDNILRMETEAGVQIVTSRVRAPERPERIVLVIASETIFSGIPPWLNKQLLSGDEVVICEPRGIGLSRWTTRNPPNYVERSHFLLGRTPDSGRIWDVAAAARYFAGTQGPGAKVWLAGDGLGAGLAIYAALLEPDIAGLILHSPATSHMEKTAPVLLNVMRVCDVPEALGMVAPRPVKLINGAGDWPASTRSLYAAAAATEQLTIIPERSTP